MNIKHLYTFVPFIISILCSPLVVRAQVRGARERGSEVEKYACVFRGRAKNLICFAYVICGCPLC